MKSLSAEWNAVHEQSSSRRPMLCPDHGRIFAHSLPDPDGSSIHVEQPHLIPVGAALAVDTDRRQQLSLPRLNQIRVRC